MISGVLLRGSGGFAEAVVRRDGDGGCVSLGLNHDRRNDVCASGARANSGDVEGDDVTLVEVDVGGGEGGLIVGASGGNRESSCGVRADLEISGESATDWSGSHRGPGADDLAAEWGGHLHFAGCSESARDLKIEYNGCCSHVIKSPC